MMICLLLQLEATYPAIVLSSAIYIDALLKIGCPSCVTPASPRGDNQKVLSDAH